MFSFFFRSISCKYTRRGIFFSYIYTFFMYSSCALLVIHPSPSPMNLIERTRKKKKRRERLPWQLAKNRIYQKYMRMCCCCFLIEWTKWSCIKCENNKLDLMSLGMKNEGKINRCTRWYWCYEYRFNRWIEEDVFGRQKYFTLINIYLINRKEKVSRCSFLDFIWSKTFTNGNQWSLDRFYYYDDNFKDIISLLFYTSRSNDSSWIVLCKNVVSRSLTSNRNVCKDWLLLEDKK